MTSTRCGVVAVVGAPNVGKSSLVNCLVGRSVSSVSFKPQTTRAPVFGVLTQDDAQAILVDTAGIQAKHRHLLDRAMTRSASSVLSGADFVLFVTEIGSWRNEDQRALTTVIQSGLPCLACVTKVDMVPDKKKLLPRLAEIGARHTFAELFPLSSRDGTNIDTLRAAILERLPEGPFGYPPDALEDEGVERRIEEEIRAQLLFHLEQEVPHGAYVGVQSLESRSDGVYVDATIFIAKASLKPIVIGHGGQMIKKIGTDARTRLERALGYKVTLKLWVKVDEDWYNDPYKLRKIGVQE